jgi:hypothetical protein
MRRHALWVVTLLWGVGCGSPTVNVVDPFAVVNWSPHDGATCIDPAWSNLTLSVCLNREVDAASAEVHVTVRPVLEDGSLGDPVSATVGLAAEDPACVEIREPGLQQATDYAIVLSALLEAADGTVLGHRLISRFRTVDNDC